MSQRFAIAVMDWAELFGLREPKPATVLPMPGSGQRWAAAILLINQSGE